MRTISLLLVALVAVVATALFLPGPVVGEAFKSASHEAYFSPGGGAEDAIVREVRAAKKSVEVAIFTCTNSDIVAMLVQQAQNGVEVRVLADEKEAARSYSKVRRLAASDVQVRLYQPPGGGTGGERPKMHHKFCVVDGKALLTGSFNYSRLADTENCENLLVVRDKRVASAYRAEFERLWSLAGE